MPAMPWLRLYTEFASDPVTQSLAFEDQRHFIVLLCLKGNGTLDRPMKPESRDRIIYRGLGLDPNTAEEAKRRLMDAELIDVKWHPKAWSKRQFLSDHSTERVRKTRKNKETGNDISPLLKRNCNAPRADTEQSQNRTEFISTANAVEGKSRGLPPCPYEQIVDLYHKTLPTLRRIVRLTPARKAQIKSRWNEDNQDLDGWRIIFEHIGESDFLMGRTKPRTDNQSPFQADLDWITKAANWVKIIEGKYHG